tara:strand:+ start:209 stop:709 length:501 start_codon:yes stop_codon:yes gene_type:complete
MIKIIILIIVIVALCNVKEGLRNCGNIRPTIPIPVKFYDYSIERCHKTDFNSVPFCKRNDTIRNIESLRKEDSILTEELLNINKTVYNDYYSQNFNHNYKDNLLGLESSIDTFNDVYNTYIQNIKTYNSQNNLNTIKYEKLDKVNKNMQQNDLNNTVNMRKYNILS